MCDRASQWLDFHVPKRIRNSPRYVMVKSWIFWKVSKDLKNICLSCLPKYLILSIQFEWKVRGHESQPAWILHEVALKNICWPWETMLEESCCIYLCTVLKTCIVCLKNTEEDLSETAFLRLTTAHVTSHHTTTRLLKSEMRRGLGVRTELSGKRLRCRQVQFL